MSGTIERLAVCIAAAIVAVMCITNVCYADSELAPTGSCGAEGSDVTWTFDEEKGELTLSGSGMMADYIKSDSPFYRKTVIKSVIISEGVRSIGNYAFARCSSLQNIVLPESLEFIGDRAFWGSALTEITIPEGVWGLGENPFYRCDSMTSINVDPDHPAWCSKDGVFYFGDKNNPHILLAYPGGKTDNVFEIPNTVRTIQRNAFTKALFSKIIIPESVVNIVDYGNFANCTDLTDIEVDANNDKYSSADGVLFNKEQTELIHYPAGKSADLYSVPSSVTDISQDAFIYADLKAVELPESLKTIGDEAFAASSIESIVIPDGVESIPYGAFMDCGNLVSIMIPNSVKSIGEGAFANCTNLLNITYDGSENEWSAIEMSGSGINDLENVEITFSPAEPDYPENAIISFTPAETVKPAMLCENESGDIELDLNWFEYSALGDSITVRVNGVEATYTYRLTRDGLSWTDEFGEIADIHVWEMVDYNVYDLSKMKTGDAFKYRVKFFLFDDEIGEAFQELVSSEEYDAVIVDDYPDSGDDEDDEGGFGDENTEDDDEGNKEPDNTDKDPDENNKPDENKDNNDKPQPDPDKETKPDVNPDSNNQSGGNTNTDDKKEPEETTSVGDVVNDANGSMKVSSISDKTVVFTKAKNKKSVTVPATVVINGETYKVVSIGAKAFKGKKIKTVTVGKNVKKMQKNAFASSVVKTVILKTKLLKKNTVKGSLKKSKVKTIKVKVGNKKQNKKFVKKYKKIFTKKIAGKKVGVK